METINKNGSSQKLRAHSNMSAGSKPHKKLFALKEMDSDRDIPSMLNHHSIKELMLLRKLDHPNIASATNAHFNHNLTDMQSYNPIRNNFKMYIEMDKAQHDLQELTLNGTRI